MREFLILGSLVGICGLFAFMIFGREKFPKSTRFVSLLLLIGINITFVVFVGKVWRETESPTLGVILLGGWFILQKYCHDTTAPPRRLAHVIFAERGATKQEEANFQPDFYFRMVRRRGWRRVELEIDEEIEVPDAEPIPVQVVADWHNTFRCRKQGLIPDQWCEVIFEYRGQTFYGQMRY